MYATCLFCHASLGANESIANFPIGKRLAFDSAKGRLWVVCDKCERWNLSPLEERWEAIEEAERAYRDSKKRVATDNIGLARLKDGTDLVRIGAPLRPEFAAWRYGDTFGRRRRNQLVTGAAMLAATTSIPVIGAIGYLGAFGCLAIVGPQIVRRIWRGRTATTVQDNEGNFHRMSREQIAWATLGTHWLEAKVELHFVPDSEYADYSWSPVGIAKRLRPTFPDGNDPTRAITLTGAAAMRALGNMLPFLNERGASNRRVASAMQLIEDQPSAAKLTNDLRRIANPGFGTAHLLDDGHTVRAGNIPSAIRLALEMTLHEADERRALEGELHVLEQRWRDADDIARIADSLTVPRVVDERLSQLRNQSAQNAHDVISSQPEV